MSFVTAKCPVCKKLQTHTTEGVHKDDEGKEYQTLICSECKTSNKIYIGEQGKDFQSNYDYPDNTDLTKTE